MADAIHAGILLIVRRADNFAVDHDARVYINSRQTNTIPYPKDNSESSVFEILSPGLYEIQVELCEDHSEKVEARIKKDYICQYDISLPKSRHNILWGTFSSSPFLKLRKLIDRSLRPEERKIFLGY